MRASELIESIIEGKTPEQALPELKKLAKDLGGKFDVSDKGAFFLFAKQDRADKFEAAVAKKYGYTGKWASDRAGSSGQYIVSFAGLKD